MQPRVKLWLERDGRIVMSDYRLRLLRLVAEVHAELSGRRLPINGAGAAGAALADLGLPPELARGFALLARTAGLLAHLAEEREQPLGMPLYREVERRMVYEPPGS